VWRLTIATCLALLAACGGVGRDDFVSAWIDADCERAARCGEYISKEACVAFEGVRRAFDREVLVLEANVASSRVSYDGGEAADCIERRRTASCDRTSADWRRSSAGCAAAFDGEVSNGGQCYLDAECRSGECAVGACSESCCVGTCFDVLAPAHIGESCAERGCVDGAFCDRNDPNQVCKALRPAGSPCGNHDECGYGLSCSEGTCVDTPARGEPCSTAPFCENWFGDVCSSASGTCEPLPVVGGLCRFNNDCQAPLVCNASVCAAPPDAGEPCLDRICGAGTYCAAGTCATQSPEGALCTVGDECTTFWCDDTGHCTSPPTCG
jgi:hypothetical protein